MGTTILAREAKMFILYQKYAEFPNNLQCVCVCGIKESSSEKGNSPNSLVNYKLQR